MFEKQSKTKKWKKPECRRETYSPIHTYDLKPIIRNKNKNGGWESKFWRDVLPLITCRMWPHNVIFNQHHDQFCWSRKSERFVNINALFKSKTTCSYPNSTIHYFKVHNESHMRNLNWVKSIFPKNRELWKLHNLNKSSRVLKEKCIIQNPKQQKLHE